jgi:hypothetical protein
MSKQNYIFPWGFPIKVRYVFISAYAAQLEAERWYSGLHMPELGCGPLCTAVWVHMAERDRWTDIWILVM